MSETSEISSAVVALHRALVAAQRDAEGQSNDRKSGDGGGPKYPYTSSEAVIAEARRVLSKNGLICRQGAHRPVDPASWLEAFQSDSAPAPPIYLEVAFEIMHEAGASLMETIHWPVIVGKGRPLDKATGAALTAAYGYYLRGLLCLDRPKADEVNDRDDSDYRPRGGGRREEGGRRDEGRRREEQPAEPRRGRDTSQAGAPAPQASAETTPGAGDQPGHVKAIVGTLRQAKWTRKQVDDLLALFGISSVEQFGAGDVPEVRRIVNLGPEEVTMRLQDAQAQARETAARAASKGTTDPGPRDVGAPAQRDATPAQRDAGRPISRKAEPVEDEVDAPFDFGAL